MREERTIDYVFKLLSISWWYYGLAAVIGLVFWLARKRVSLGLLVGYAFLLIVETVLIRKVSIGSHFQSELFWSWKAFDTQREQIITNVVIFIPVGILAGYLWKWKGLLLAAGLSIVIELLQLVTARGLCEFDDVFHNCFGALIGVLFVILVRWSKNK